MSASIEAKEFGFKTLTEVSELSGFTSRQLGVIYKSNHQGFVTILWGSWIRKAIG